MIQLKFDQADIDVAETFFQQIKIEGDDKIVASSIAVASRRKSIQSNERSVAWLQKTEDQDSINANIELFVSSHFHDNYLLSLDTVTDTIPGEESEKRQRLGSSHGHELKRRRTVPQYAELKVLDSLTTVSPI